MAPIELGAPVVQGGRIEVSIRPGDARRYFAGDLFWVDYGELDLSRLPAQIALLPALGVVLPVAIAVGVPVIVPTLDRVFAAHAGGIDEHLRGLYPAFAQTPLQLSGLTAADTWKPAHPDGAALLYSGGIDSVTSLIRHRDQVRALVSVWGADVEVEDVDLWSSLREITAAAPVLPDARQITARTNMRRVIDEVRLNRRFDRGFAGTNWWGGAHHGLGLTSLIGPVTRALGLGPVLLASSHTEQLSLPWGSSPALDNQVKWTGAEVEHDGYEFDRQDKIGDVVAPFIRDGHALKLSVCYQVNRGGDNINCGRCEKCLRTASGLLAADVDPKLAGVPVGQPELDEWRRKMDTGQVEFAPSALLLTWTEVQRAIPADTTNDYLLWLRHHDLRQHVAAGEPRAPVGDLPWWQYAGLRLAGRLPYRLRRDLRARAATVIGSRH